MKRKIFLTFILFCIVFTSALPTVHHGNEKVPRNVQESEESTAPYREQITSDSTALSAKDDEMRGVWIPCMSLVLDDSERSESGFREKFSDIAERCVKNGLNTVIVHVRPYGDAVYRSKIFPWSHILSGTQGKAVDFDPLKIMLEEAHKRGLAFHAWINPLRISTGQTPQKLSDDNPYIKWKSDPDTDISKYTFEYGGGIYYDPSAPEVRRLILDGVRELTENYDIDGIQIDDYFYPSEETDYDRKNYESYCGTISDGSVPLSQSEWRKNNINMLVCGMYDIVHGSGRDMVFGISPQCNFENNEKISADVKSWCSISGYADYICPQIYVSNDHPVFPFRELADEWCDFVTNGMKLYFGLGLYKQETDADSGTWLDAGDVIASQKEYSRKKKTGGYILFSYDYLK